MSVVRIRAVRIIFPVHYYQSERVSLIQTKIFQYSYSFYFSLVSSSAVCLDVWILYCYHYHYYHYVHYLYSYLYLPLHLFPTHLHTIIIIIKLSPLPPCLHYYLIVTYNILINNNLQYNHHTNYKPHPLHHLFSPLFDFFNSYQYLPTTYMIVYLYFLSLNSVRSCLFFHINLMNFYSYN